jgi:hypothetical protein
MNDGELELPKLLTIGGFFVILPIWNFQRQFIY